MITFYIYGFRYHFNGVFNLRFENELIRFETEHSEHSFYKKHVRDLEYVR